MENKTGTNCKKENKPPKSNSVTDIYYGKSLKLSSGSGQLWAKFSSMFTKSRNPVNVKYFKDAGSPTRSFFKQNNLATEAIQPTSNQRYKLNEAIGMAMGLELPNIDNTDNLVITVELEPIKKFKKPQAHVTKNKAVMKLVKKNKSKSVFTGVMTLPSNTDIRKLSQIPLYIIDSNENIIPCPTSQVSYKTCVKGIENMENFTQSEVQVKFEVNATKNRTKNDRIDSISSFKKQDKSNKRNSKAIPLPPPPAKEQPAKQKHVNIVLDDENEEKSKGEESTWTYTSCSNSSCNNKVESKSESESDQSDTYTTSETEERSESSYNDSTRGLEKENVAQLEKCKRPECENPDCGVIKTPAKRSGTNCNNFNCKNRSQEYNSSDTINKRNFEKEVPQQEKCKRTECKNLDCSVLKTRAKRSDTNCNNSNCKNRSQEYNSSDTINEPNLEKEVPQQEKCKRPECENLDCSVIKTRAKRSGTKCNLSNCKNRSQEYNSADTINEPNLEKEVPQQEKCKRSECENLDCSVIKTRAKRNGTKCNLSNCKNRSQEYNSADIINEPNLEKEVPHQENCKCPECENPDCNVLKTRAKRSDSNFKNSNMKHRSKESEKSDTINEPNLEKEVSQQEKCERPECTNSDCSVLRTRAKRSGPKYNNSNIKHRSKEYNTDTGSTDTVDESNSQIKSNEQIVSNADDPMIESKKQNDSVRKFVKTSTSEPIPKRGGKSSECKCQLGNSQNISTQHSQKERVCSHTKGVEAQYSLLFPLFACYTKFILFLQEKHLKEASNPLYLNVPPKSSISGETQYPRSLTSTSDDDTTSMTSESSSSRTKNEDGSTNPEMLVTSSPNHQEVETLFPLETKYPQLIDNSCQYDEFDNKIARFSYKPTITSDGTLEVLEKARQKLADYIEKRYCSDCDKTFTDEELLSVCSILQTGQITQDISLSKHSEDPVKKKTRIFSGALKVHFLNRKEPRHIPLTEFQYSLVASSRNPSQIKSVKSLSRLINNDFEENVEDLSDANTRLVEEVLSLQLVGNEMWTRMISIFEQPQIEQMEFDEKGTKSGEMVENIKEDLASVLLELQDALQTIDFILGSVVLEHFYSIFEVLPLNGKSLCKPKLKGVGEGAHRAATSVGVESTDSPACNAEDAQEMFQQYAFEYLSRVNAIDSEIEDDIQKTLKELLRESEDIKNTAILNGSFEEEEEPPFFIEGNNSTTKPSPLVICESNLNESSSTVDKNRSSSNDTNRKSYGDTVESFRIRTKHIFDMILKQVAGQKFILKTCRYDTLSRELRDKKLSFGGNNTGKPYGGSCSHISEVDAESTNKKGENKTKIDGKKMYFCNVLASKIPKTSFSFGAGSRSKSKNHFKTNSKTQGRRKYLIDEILNGEYGNSRSEFLHKLSCKHFDDMSAYVEPNLKVCNFSISKTDQNSSNEKVTDDVHSSNSNSSENEAEERCLNFKNVDGTANQSSGNLILPPNRGEGSNYSNDADKSNQASSSFGIPENNHSAIAQNSSTSKSNASDEGKLWKSQKRFKITGNFESDMQANLPSTSTKNSENCEEFLIEYVDLTHEDPNNPAASEDEILIKIQNLGKHVGGNISKGSSSFERSNPPSDDKKIEIITFKPTNDTMLSDDSVLSYLSSTSAGYNFHSNCVNSADTHSHVILKNVYAKTNIVEAQMAASEKSRLEATTEVEITSPSTSSSFASSEAFEEHFRDNDSLEISLNLPLNEYESKEELSSPEEIALIEENVRENMLLEERYRRVAHFACENEYYVYEDVKISNTSMPIISRSSEET